MHKLENHIFNILNAISLLIFSWVNALSTAHELRCDPIVDQLLQDCLQILPMEDASQGHFVEDCLPLLFAIFRNSKVRHLKKKLFFKNYLWL